MRRLLIFLKYPSPGRVKTRLAASVGPEAAADVSRACTELTLEHVRRFRDEAVLCVDPPEALARTRRWLGEGWNLQPQQGRTLGERLAQATRCAFADGATSVVVMGTDAPWLQDPDVEAAFAALSLADLVLGPAQDGGYYLVGLSRSVPALFEGIQWGTSSVYAETLTKAHGLGLAVQTLQPGYDVDRLEDLQRLLTDERVHGRSPALLATVARVSKRREPCLS